MSTQENDSGGSEGRGLGSFAPVALLLVGGIWACDGGGNNQVRTICGPDGANITSDGQQHQP
ncbi:MAG: hypothetical protein ABIK09_08095 [Pseudomonadota bacterium]